MKAQDAVRKRIIEITDEKKLSMNYIVVLKRQNLNILLQPFKANQIKGLS